jgi:hypothetical protein
VFRIFLIVISALAHNSHSKALDLQRSQFSFQSTWSATLATLASRLCGYSTRVFFILLYEQVLSNSVKHIFCIGCYLLWYQLSFIHILLVYRWTYLINRCMHVVVIVVLIEFNCWSSLILLLLELSFPPFFMLEFIEVNVVESCLKWGFCDYCAWYCSLLSCGSNCYRIL